MFNHRRHYYDQVEGMTLELLLPVEKQLEERVRGAGNPYAVQVYKRLPYSIVLSNIQLP